MRSTIDTTTPITPPQRRILRMMAEGDRPIRRSFQSFRVGDTDQGECRPKTLQALLRKGLVRRIRRNEDYIRWLRFEHTLTERGRRAATRHE